MKYLTRLKQHIPKHIMHKGEHLAHFAYLTLVFIESHSMYGPVAGILGIFVVINYFTTSGEI